MLDNVFLFCDNVRNFIKKWSRAVRSTKFIPEMLINLTNEFMSFFASKICKTHYKVTDGVVCVLTTQVGKFSGISLFLTRHTNRPAFLSTEKKNKKARHIINLYLKLNYIIMTYFNTNENSITNAKIETLVSNNGEKNDV